MEQFIDSRFRLTGSVGKTRRPSNLAHAQAKSIEKLLIAQVILFVVLFRTVFAFRPKSIDKVTVVYSFSIL